MKACPGKTTINPTKQNKTWRYGLCECCEDPTLACTVCWCGCNATGQAYQRATGSGCFWISIVLWALFILTQSMNSTANSLNANVDTNDNVVGMSVVRGLAGLLGLISTIATTYFVCTSRRIMRERDAIPTGWCGSCSDCCIGWWCSCCALIQMFRQDSITGKEYRLCAKEAV